MKDVIFFSASTMGAYLAEVHGDDMPSDIVRVPLSEWQTLLATLASSTQTLGADEQGRPMLVDPPPPARPELEALERFWRDAQLSLTDPLVARHRDELELGSTTLTAKHYSELQRYRRQLRDWPQTDGFPLTEHRPLTPGWLATPVL